MTEHHQGGPIVRIYKIGEKGREMFIPLEPASLAALEALNRIKARVDQLNGKTVTVSLRRSHSRMDKLRARAKALAAVLIPLGAIVVATVSNSNVTNVWLAAVAVLTALGVYVTPNKPAAP